MEKRTVIRRGVILAAASALVAAYGCERPNPYKLSGDTGAVYEDCPSPSTGSGNTTTSGTSGSGGDATSGSTGSGTTTSTGSGSTGSGGGGPEVPVTELDDREVDYYEAYRTASLLLVGDLPTLAKIYELADTAENDLPTKYAALVDELFADPRFADMMLNYHRATFKMAGPSTVSGEPTRETAPTFAARVVVTGQDWRQILTATTNTCPTYNKTTKTFSDGNCNNLMAGMQHSGILTDPGVHSLYYGNLAFRRNRFFHETFLCKSANEDAGAEPAGVDQAPTEGPCGQGTAPQGYNNKWSIATIAGACNGGRVDFHAYNATTICANCHSTWNHRAPLWAYFNKQGVYMPTMQVEVPVENSPKAAMSDFLAAGQTTAWKFGMPASNLNELGQAMAADSEVLECAVKRAWNYAMSRGDTTTVGGQHWVELSDNGKITANAKTLADLMQVFQSNNYNLKVVLREIMLSDDFVRF